MAKDSAPLEGKPGDMDRVSERLGLDWPTISKQLVGTSLLLGAFMALLYLSLLEPSDKQVSDVTHSLTDLLGTCIERSQLQP